MINWMHIGGGNIFRMFPARAAQELLEAGLMKNGIAVVETFDHEIIEKNFIKNKTIAVTLRSNGEIITKEVKSISAAYKNTQPEAMEAFLSPDLQMISFTITEKGYAPPNHNEDSENAMLFIAHGLIARAAEGLAPIALVSMDNCSRNGDVLRNGVSAAMEMINPTGKAARAYLSACAFPWTAIDKITPRPSEFIAKKLKESGLSDGVIHVTKKGTWVADFVMAEETEYLLIEDAFPSGRPPLHETGIIFTNRETVEKFENMKVRACLNPLHTALSVCGCLLGVSVVSECMKESVIKDFIKALSKETTSVVSDPEVISPSVFLEDVLEKRLTNPFIGDTVERIVLDTSSKIPIRFGENIKLRRERGLSDNELKLIPLFFALWLRYLQGKDDLYNVLEVQYDPRASELIPKLDSIEQILKDESVWGADLYFEEAYLAQKTNAYFEVLQPLGAVRETLKNAIAKI